MRDDYRYSQEALDHEFKVVWECDQCGEQREDYPGYNEGGQCHCGGTFFEIGESYLG